MKGKIISACIIASSLVFSITVLSSSAEEQSIPSWIKNIAGWWVDGEVGDFEFISSMQWLVSEGIIIIPSDKNSERIKNLESLVAQWESSYKELEQETKQSDYEKRYLKKDFGFLMLQPENWEKQKVYPDPIEGNIVYSMIESSTFEEFQPTEINVIIEDMKGLSLEDYYRSEWNFYAPILSSYGELEFIDSELTEVMGEKAISTSIAYYVESEDSMLNPVPTQVKLKSKSIVVEHKGDGYTISFIATEENFDKHLNEFDDIMDTFRFL